MADAPCGATDQLPLLIKDLAAQVGGFLGSSWTLSRHSTDCQFTAILAATVSVHVLSPVLRRFASRTARQTVNLGMASSPCNWPARKSSSGAKCGPETGLHQRGRRASGLLTWLGGSTPPCLAGGEWRRAMARSLEPGRCQSPRGTACGWVSHAASPFQATCKTLTTASKPAIRRLGFETPAACGTTQEGLRRRRAGHDPRVRNTGRGRSETGLPRRAVRRLFALRGVSQGPDFGARGAFANQLGRAFRGLATLPKNQPPPEIARDWLPA